MKALSTELRRLEKERGDKLDANGEKWEAACIAAARAALYDVDPEIENDLDDLILAIARTDESLGEGHHEAELARAADGPISTIELPDIVTAIVPIISAAVAEPNRKHDSNETAIWTQFRDQVAWVRQHAGRRPDNKTTASASHHDSTLVIKPEPQ